jgi:hypothetical protein
MAASPTATQTKTLNLTVRQSNPWRFHNCHETPDA